MQQARCQCSHPKRLFVVGSRQLFPNCVWIVQCPDGQLLQYADLGEDIEVVEFGGFFVDAKGVVCGRLGDVLATRVLVEELQAGKCRLADRRGTWGEGGNAR